MYNQVIYLIPVTESTNNMGIPTEAEGAARAVFCHVQSVSMNENFSGVTAGFKPELRAALSDKLDYQGEKLCELDGVRYEIYRTYMSGTGNGIELYLQRRAGVVSG